MDSPRPHDPAPGIVRDVMAMRRLLNGPRYTEARERARRAGYAILQVSQRKWSLIKLEGGSYSDATGPDTLVQLTQARVVPGFERVDHTKAHREYCRLTWQEGQPE